MFIAQFLKYIQGVVKFSASGGFIEKFLNTAIKEDIRVWNVTQKNEIFYAFCRRGDYMLIAKKCKKSGIRTRVVSRYGFFFFIHKYRKRLGIAVGSAAFALFIIIMQSFIWTVEVIGNEKIPSGVLIHTLRDFGIKAGALKYNLDYKRIEHEMITLFDNISWLAINQKGSHVALELREGEPPELEDYSEPCNIIAKKSGQIVYVESISGESMVSEGMYVAEGELLISGIAEDINGSIFIKHARGKVIARTEETRRFSRELTEKRKQYTGKVKNRRVIELLGFKIPLFFSGKLKGEYETQSSGSRLSPFGYDLPFALHTNKYRFYSISEETITADTARKQLEKEIGEYETQKFASTEIVDKKRVEVNAGGKFHIDITYICEQDIAKNQPIQIQN